MTDPTELKNLFRAPQFVNLGLMALSSEGVIRRGGWDDYFAPVVRDLGLGVPVVPLDGVGLRDFPTVGLEPIKVALKSNKKGNVFEPGDELVITVKNESHRPAWIELVGTSARGRKVILTHEPIRVAPSQCYRFPPKGGITIRGGVGKEQITLFASHDSFPGGELLRGAYVSDRVVHPYYQYHKQGNRWTRRLDAANIVKKTIDIETK